MKKFTILIVLAFFCLHFFCYARQNNAIDITSRGLQSGDTVPDVTISGIHHYKTSTAKLSDFRGKLLILDFFATWCSPCLAMLPRIDSLQKQFGDRVQFLPVTYQKEDEVLPFLEKLEKQQGRHYSLPVVTGDTVLGRLFPYRVLPHYVWIGPDGRPAATTGRSGLNRETVESLIRGRLPEGIRMKQDTLTAYNPRLPLLVNNNGGTGGSLLYHSVLTGYAEGLKSFYTIEALEGSAGARLSMTNLSVRNLFAFAWASGGPLFNSKRIIISSRDSVLLRPAGNIPHLQWLKGHGYCYELIVPPALSGELFSIAQKELGRFLPQYRVSIEPRMQACMVLTRTSGRDRIRSSGGKAAADFSPFGFTLSNLPLQQVVTRLNTIYMQNSPYWIADGTGYSGPADLKVEARLDSFEELNRALKPYDLKFIRKEVPVDMLIIRDSGASPVF